MCREVVFGLRPWAAKPNWDEAQTAVAESRPNRIFGVEDKDSARGYKNEARRISDGKQRLVRPGQQLPGVFPLAAVLANVSAQKEKATLPQCRQRGLGCPLVWDSQRRKTPSRCFRCRWPNLRDRLTCRLDFAIRPGTRLRGTESLYCLFPSTHLLYLLISTDMCHGQCTDPFILSGSCHSTSQTPILRHRSMPTPRTAVFLPVRFAL
jgi:hypothetical protein